MRGRIWLIFGTAIGIAAGVGKVPYVAGAASSFAETALRVVHSAGLTLIREAAQKGAPRRTVEGFSALVGVLVPGVAAFLLFVAARASLFLRSLIGVLLLALGVANFIYFPSRHAVGTTALALGVAALVVVATGPLVAAPLAAVGALIGTEFLPKLLSERALPTVPVSELHQALFASSGSPEWLRIVVLVVAALPFAAAARLLLR